MWQLSATKLNLLGSTCQISAKHSVIFRSSERLTSSSSHLQSQNVLDWHAQCQRVPKQAK